MLEVPFNTRLHDARKPVNYNNADSTERASRCMNRNDQRNRHRRTPQEMESSQPPPPPLPPLTIPRKSLMDAAPDGAPPFDHDHKENAITGCDIGGASGKCAILQLNTARDRLVDTTSIAPVSESAGFGCTLASPQNNCCTSSPEGHAYTLDTPMMLPARVVLEPATVDHEDRKTPARVAANRAPSAGTIAIATNAGSGSPELCEPCRTEKTHGTDGGMNIATIFDNSDRTGVGAAETKLASELEVFLLRSPCLTPPKEVISVNTRTSDVGTTNPEHGLSRIDHTPGSDDTKGRVTPAHVTFDEVLTSWHQPTDQMPSPSAMTALPLAAYAHNFSLQPKPRLLHDLPEVTVDGTSNSLSHAMPENMWDGERGIHEGVIPTITSEVSNRHVIITAPRDDVIGEGKDVDSLTAATTAAAFDHATTGRAANRPMKTNAGSQPVSRYMAPGERAWALFPKARCSPAEYGSTLEVHRGTTTFASKKKLLPAASAVVAVGATSGVSRAQSSKAGRSSSSAVRGKGGTGRADCRAKTRGKHVARKSRRNGISVPEYDIYGFTDISAEAVCRRNALINLATADMARVIHKRSFSDKNAYFERMKTSHFQMYEQWSRAKVQFEVTSNAANPSFIAEERAGGMYRKACQDRETAQASVRDAENETAIARTSAREALETFRIKTAAKAQAVALLQALEVGTACDSAIIESAKTTVQSDASGEELPCAGKTYGERKRQRDESNLADGGHRGSQVKARGQEGDEEEERQERRPRQERSSNMFTTKAEERKAIAQGTDSEGELKATMKSHPLSTAGAGAIRHAAARRSVFVLALNAAAAECDAAERAVKEAAIVSRRAEYDFRATAGVYDVPSAIRAENASRRIHVETQMVAAPHLARVNTELATQKLLRAGLDELMRHTSVAWEVREKARLSLNDAADRVLEAMSVLSGFSGGDLVDISRHSLFKILTEESRQRRGRIQAQSVDPPGGGSSSEGMFGDAGRYHNVDRVPHESTMIPPNV